MVFNGPKPLSVVIVMTLGILIFALPHPAPTRAMHRSESKSTSAVPEMLPLPDSDKLNVMQKAYLDVYSILSSDNSCADFFGGPLSINALNKLLPQLRSSFLGPRLSIRMSGATSLYQDFKTNFTYRLFDKMEVNSAGPFFQSRTPLGPTIPFVGVFPPNTREARATILLHELGHLIRTPNNNWVLADDGTDPAKSEANTDRVLKVCRDQIDALHQFSFEIELAQAELGAPRPQP